MADRMTDEHFDLMLALLVEFCSTELDQWELWVSKEAGAYIVVSREAILDGDYMSIDPIITIKRRATVLNVGNRVKVQVGTVTDKDGNTDARFESGVITVVTEDAYVVSTESGSILAPQDNVSLDEDTPEESSVPEGEDAPVASEEPVSISSGGNDSVDDGLVKMVPAEGPVELSGTEAEDAAVSGEDVVSPAVESGTDSNNGGV